MSKLIRYRPVFKGKDAEMRPDESGDWTSLACYYSLHDRLVRGEAHVAALQAENERLRKAGDAMENRLYEFSGDFDLNPFEECSEWNKAKAKGVQP